MTNVDWLLILYALLFGGSVLALMIGLVYLEVWLLQQATNLVERCCRWWHQRAEQGGSAVCRSASEDGRSVSAAAVPVAVPNAGSSGDHAGESGCESNISGQDVSEFEQGWVAGSDSVPEFGEAFQVDAEEPVKQPESQESEFQPILTSVNLDVYPERLRYHARMLTQLRARASPLLKASIENNIACCFAHVGDIATAATIFRQARKRLIDEPTLYDVTLSDAGLLNMRELVELGVAGIAEQLAGLEEFLSNPDFSLLRQRVIDVVNANLDRAHARLSGR